MIAGFQDKEAEELFRTRHASKRLSPYADAALRKLVILNAATAITDLASPPGNQLKNVGGTQDTWQSRIDQRHRVRFRWIGHDAHDVRIGDFHQAHVRHKL
jgi:proteic killer suppression protein